MTCTNIEEVVGCYTDADGVRTNVIIHNVADADGVVIATLYLDSAHVPVAGATAETVTPGACPVAQPDVEWVQYCDELTDGSIVPFMCRVITSFDTAGVAIEPVQTDFFEMDKVTAYTPAGEVTVCNGCPDITDAGVLTAWDALRAATA